MPVRLRKLIGFYPDHDIKKIDINGTVLTLKSVMFDGPETFGYVSLNMYRDSSNPNETYPITSKVEELDESFVITPNVTFEGGGNPGEITLQLVTFDGPGTFGYVTTNLLHSGRVEISQKQNNFQLRL